MQTHFHDGPGFSRLTDLIPGTVAIARGNAATSLGSNPASTATDAAPSARAARGDPSAVDLSQNANADQKIQNALAFQEEDPSLRSNRLMAPSTPADRNEPEGFAQYLASTLGDATLRNIAFYRLVVRTVPRHVIQDALGRAKDARNVRKSRAHLFAYLIRDQLPKRTAPRPNP